MFEEEFAFLNQMQFPFLGNIDALKDAEFEFIKPADPSL